METGSVSFSVLPHAHVLVLPLLCGILWKNAAGFLVPFHTGPKESLRKSGRFFQKWLCVHFRQRSTLLLFSTYCCPLQNFCNIWYGYLISSGYRFLVLRILVLSYDILDCPGWFHRCIHIFFHIFILRNMPILWQNTRKKWISPPEFNELDSDGASESSGRTCCFRTMTPAALGHEEDLPGFPWQRTQNVYCIFQPYLLQRCFFCMSSSCFSCPGKPV